MDHNKHQQSVVAVGMPVTQHPPHRTSARATNAHGSHLGFTHGLPAYLNVPGSVSGMSWTCRVLLGQRPSLHSFLRPSQVFVRLLRRYYAAARLPTSVHPGLMALRFLPAVRSLLAADSDGVSRFSRVKFLCMRGVFDSAGPSVCSRCLRTRPFCLPVWPTPSTP